SYPLISATHDNEDGRRWKTAKQCRVSNWNELGFQGKLGKRQKGLLYIFVICLYGNKTPKLTDSGESGGQIDITGRR
uniref:hypothetical protein n=1 Tax=Parabacteroides johnsonii TaxID=387661 RepID=UPI002431E998